jgi:hypothetical protein
MRRAKGGLLSGVRTGTRIHERMRRHGERHLQNVETDPWKRILATRGPRSEQAIPTHTAAMTALASVSLPFSRV